MTERPGFGVLLDRLLKHRGTGLARLAGSSGIAEYELRALIDGTAPSESQLRDLAPALGFHAADLFVIADVPVPEDLTPLDPGASGAVENLVHVMWNLPPEQRRRIHGLAAELPQEPRPENVPERSPRVFDQSRGGFAAMLVTMLYANRNLGRQSAYVAAVLTRGRMYLSVPTYPMMAKGAGPFPPERIEGFATVLGIPAADLAALTGIAPPDEPRRDDPLAAELAAMVWTLRRLTKAQASRLAEEARSMLVPLPDDATDKEWNRLFHVPGQGWFGAPRTPGE